MNEDLITPDRVIMINAKMSAIHLFVLLLSTVTVLELTNAGGSMDMAWQRWKHEHTKQYSGSGEEGKRHAIWQQKVDEITQHNLRFDMGLESYKKGLNQFSDMTWDELKQLYLSLLDVGKAGKSDKQETHGSVDLDALPDEVDWRKKGYVTKIKDQGGCGSCWAFSAVGTLEGQLANKTKQNATDLSVQQLVDCNRLDNYGCNGGFPALALNYTEYFGIQTSESYPYTGRDGNCTYNKSQVAFQNSDLLYIEDAGEPILQQMVAFLGPVSVGIEVTDDFFDYKSGIFKTKDCDPEVANHGVLAIGYGDEDGEAYWLVKNSWGTKWGEQGYTRMARNNGNMCSIATYPSVAII